MIEVVFLYQKSQILGHEDDGFTVSKALERLVVITSYCRLL